MKYHNRTVVFDHPPKRAPFYGVAYFEGKAHELFRWEGKLYAVLFGILMLMLSGCHVHHHSGAYAYWGAGAPTRVVYPAVRTVQVVQPAPSTTTVVHHRTVHVQPQQARGCTNLNPNVCARRVAYAPPQQAQPMPRAQAHRPTKVKRPRRPHANNGMRNHGAASRGQLPNRGRGKKR